MYDRQHDSIMNERNGKDVFFVVFGKVGYFFLGNLFIVFVHALFIRKGFLGLIGASKGGYQRLF